MAYEFKHSRRVEFSETDLAGIMHFSNFFRFMEAAETAFLRSLGLSVVLSRAGLDVCLPRVHAECDYGAPLHFEDEVLIHLLVERKGARTLTYQFRFIRQNESPPREVARGRIVAVCATRKQNGALKAVPLPALITDKIETAPAAMLEAGPSPLPGAADASSPPGSSPPPQRTRKPTHDKPI